MASTMDCTSIFGQADEQDAEGEEEEEETDELS